MSRYQNLGFSLLELLIVLSMVIIFLLAADITFSHLLQRNKTNAVVNQLLTAINYTRSNAILKNAVITFCGSSDHQQCDGRWEDGQIVTIENTQQTLQVYPGLHKGERLIWHSNLGKNSYLKLAPTGFTYGQNGSFYYCPKFAYIHYGAIIVVALSGRARVSFNSAELQQMCG